LCTTTSLFVKLNQESQYLRIVFTSNIVYTTCNCNSTLSLSKDGTSNWQRRGGGINSHLNQNKIIIYNPNTRASHDIVGIIIDLSLPLYIWITCTYGSPIRLPSHQLLIPYTQSSPNLQCLWSNPHTFTNVIDQS
jgi:hypothetical protein